MDSIISRVLDPISQRTGYVVNLQKNLDSLKNAMNELKCVRDDVKTRVEVAERQKLKRTHYVHWWLEKVEAVEGEVNAMVKESKKVTRTSLSGYRLCKKVAMKLDDVINLKSKADSLDVVAEKPLPDAIEEMPCTSAVGMDFMLSNALALISEDEVGIFGIYGMGGVGKTTLLKKINNEFLVRTHAFAFIIWVVVSKELNVEKIQKDIGQRLGLSWVENESNNETRARDIYKVLSRKKFMLLFDDTWKSLDLEMIGIPHPNSQNKSKVVFTTRFENVMAADKKIRVECLQEQESINLFRQNVGEETMISHQDIPALAMRITKECKGLPLALITIGRAMACKKTPQEWTHAISVLSTSKPPSAISGMDDEMLLRLKFSYDNLGGDMIKSCFLYCALFPEDYPIHKEKLIDYWIGEGFLERWDDDLDQARNEGHDNIGRLKAACLLENGSDETTEVKLHDVIRDLALWIASECGKKKNRFLVRAGVGLTHAPEFERWKEAERISLMNNKIKEVTGTPQCPNLLTLMLQRNKGFEMVHTEFFQFMPLLRVLDLSMSRMVVELPAAIGNLEELRYLNLSYTGITSLPEEIGNLGKMQHLEFQSSYLQKLPAGIGNLAELRYLNLSDTQITSLPEEIGNLVKMQHLEFQSSWLQELPAGIGDLAELRHLNLSYTQITSLPEEIGDLAELRYLNLSDTKITSLPEEIGNLVNMQHLDFQHSRLQELPAGIGDLVELRYLNISATEITSLPEEIGNLVKLKHLGLDHTRRLSTIPQGVISTLSELRVLGMSYSKWEEGSEGLKMSELEGLERLNHLNLTLSNLHALERLLCSSKLRNVTRSLYLYRCKDLTNQLSSLFAAMKSLQLLTLSGCNGLEEVTINGYAKKDDDYPVSSLEWLYLEDLRDLNCIRVGRGCFRNLHTIKISTCHKLKKIYGLLQLESLEKIEIACCSELEEVIGTVIPGDEVGDIGLMQPKCISLRALPKLTRIFSYALHFPSLEEITVSDCPKLKKLPLPLHSARNSLRIIHGSKEWWDNLEWEEDGIKSYFLPFLHEIDQPYDCQFEWEEGGNFF